MLRNVHVGTVVALVLSAVLIWTGFWAQIWVLFGGANQLMASLALLLIALWLMSKGKNYLWAFIPFVFMFITTMAALLYTIYQSFAALTTGKIIADILAVILFICAVILAYDGIKAFLGLRAEMAKAPEAGGGE